MWLAGASDAPAIAALVESAYRGDESRRGWTTEAELFPDSRTNVQEIAGLLADPDARFVLAHDGAELVGCAMIRNEQGTGYFGMFAVKPKLQGAGLGKQLLTFAEEQARTLWNCREMAMTVVSIRAELIAFYERRGYRQTATKPFPFDKEPGARRKDFHFLVLTKPLV
jgi:GNAT superfamily N-acetyltransferase